MNIFLISLAGAETRKKSLITVMGFKITGESVLLSLKLLFGFMRNATDVRNDTDI